jgi:hypothetical protein
MRFLALAFFCACGVLSAPQVGAANMPGNACTEAGKTMRSDDNANIIACVYARTSFDSCAAGSLCWKTMSTAPLTKCASGVISTIDNGAATCASGVSALSCPSGQAIVKIVNGVPVCGTP